MRSAPFLVSLVLLATTANAAEPRTPTPGLAYQLSHSTCSDRGHP
jgi:hypothetical protein